MINHGYRCEQETLQNRCRRWYDIPCFFLVPTQEFSLTHRPGGTNTDAVVACRTEITQNGNTEHSSDHNIEILASYKSQTTPNVTDGIRTAIQEVITAAQVPHSSVISVNIGTTHFINAVVQADRSNLKRVAVLRLCGPFCREVPPFTDFPAALREVVEGYSAYLDGGLESMCLQI